MGLLHTKWYRETEFSTGPRDLITDVPGLAVGHVTIAEGSKQTGFTAIIPREDIFLRKCCAASHVINGFGKTAGLVQVNELGSLESPILMCNTLQVGTAWQALSKYLVEKNPELRSVNPVVVECNDGYLNDIRTFSLTEEMAQEAIDNAGRDFAEGAVGAGRGMVCHGLSGGIGSASRIIDLAGEIYTLGVLVLANHGLMRDLIFNGKEIGPQIWERIQGRKAEAQNESKIMLNEAESAPGNIIDQGSVIVIIATDIPLDSLQLRRISHRAVSGLSRTGSKMGHGSGEIVITFTTANEIPHKEESPFRSQTILANQEINKVFRMTVDAVEESVLSSLIHAEKVQGVGGHNVESLVNFV